MNIAVIGTGYVGLVTGTCFAEMGNQVVCVDIDKEKVELMKGGVVPIYEPHLDILFERNASQGRLTFTTSLEEGIRDAKIIFLALPTPAGEDGSADVSHVLNVARQIGKRLRSYKLIVTKSTVPVGTAEKVQKEIARYAKVDFEVASNPEFLREGFAVDDFMKPDRVIVGTSSAKARKVLKDLYAPFLRQGNPIYFMDERSAEISKYAANAFLATKITFMNEVAALCEKTGADIDQVRIGIGSDSRIGKRFLFAGIGYGGSCFPKDVTALNHLAQKAGYDFKILPSVMEVNNRQKLILVEKAKKYFMGKLKGKKIAIWGIAFKPDTDDIREAPAVYIINALLKKGVSIGVFDPAAMDNARKLYGNRITYGNNPYDILEDADALLIATEWALFRTPDFNRLRSAMKKPVIFDGRNLYDLQSVKELGFYYSSIGRNVVE